MPRLRNPGDYFRSFPIVRVAGLVVAALALFSQGALAGNHIRVLRGTLGAAATERGEVVLANDCRQAATAEIQGINILSQAGDDAIFVETVELAAGESKVLPIPFPDPPIASGRWHIELSVKWWTRNPPSRRSHCLLRAAVAAIDAQGQVATSAGLRSDGELVQAVSEKAIHRIGHPVRDSGKLLRLGTGQGAEVLVVNRCRFEIVYRVATTDVGSREEPVVTETFLAPGDGSVIPVDDEHKDWVVIRSVAQPVHKPGRNRSARPCSRGDVDASITVFNSDGGTQQVGLLLPAVQAAREAAR